MAKRKRRPVVNRLLARMHSIVEKYVVDVPPEKREAFREHLEEFFVEAIEHAAEGAVKGAKS